MRLLVVLALMLSACATSDQQASAAATAVPTKSATTAQDEHAAKRAECEAAGQRYHRPSGECYGGTSANDADRTPRPTRRPTPTPVPRENIVVVDYGYSTFRGEYDEGDSLSWAVILENPNQADTWIGTGISVSVTFKDAGGGVVSNAGDTVAAILPEQTVAIAGADSHFSNPDLELIASMEVQLGTPRWEMAEESLGAFTVSGIQTRTSEFGGVNTTATVASTFEREMESVYATAVYYGAEGNIIGGDWTFVDFIPAGGEIAFEISGFSAMPGITGTEVYLTLSFISLN